MASFNKFNATVADLGLKKHNLNTDTLKVALTNSAPLATNAVLADITQIAAANGYSSGGTAVGTSAYSQTGGVAKLSGGNVVFTAAGGNIGPLRYAVLYNSTAAGGPLLGWWDYGGVITLLDTQTLTVQWDGTNGIFTVQ